MYELLYSYPTHWQETEVCSQYAFTAGQALCLLLEYPGEEHINPDFIDSAFLQGAAFVI